MARRSAKAAADEAEAVVPEAVAPEVGVEAASSADAEVEAPSQGGTSPTDALVTDASAAEAPVDPAEDAPVDDAPAEDAPAGRAASRAVLPPADPAELESLARAALAEIAPAEQVGALLELRPGAEDGLVDVVLEPLQRGYQGWSWVVTIATVADAVTGEAVPPTVLELGLLPGEGALLAPEWVPWSVRLAEWEAQQAVLAAEAAELGGPGEDAADEDDTGEDDTDEDELDDADLDEFDEDEDEADEDPDADDEDDADDDFDEDGPTRTHGGDIDGVDIDDLDDSDD